MNVENNGKLQEEMGKGEKYTPGQKEVRKVERREQFGKRDKKDTRYSSVWRVTG